MEKTTRITNLSALILGLLVTVSAHSQQTPGTSLPKGYIQCYPKYGKFQVDGAVVDFRELKPYFGSNQGALAEYKQFLRKEHLSTAFAIVGLASLITAITQLPGNKWDAAAFLGGSILSIGIGFNIHCKSTPHLSNAISIYNEGLTK